MNNNLITHSMGPSGPQAPCTVFLCCGPRKCCVASGRCWQGLPSALAAFPSLTFPKTNLAVSQGSLISVSREAQHINTLLAVESAISFTSGSLCQVDYPEEISRLSLSKLTVQQLQCAARPPRAPPNSERGWEVPSSLLTDGISENVVHFG